MPWERVIYKESFSTRPGLNVKADKYDPECKWIGKGLRTRVMSNSKIIGWRPCCNCYDELYRDGLPRTKSKRKRHQQDKADRWFKRARLRPGLDSWDKGKSIILDPFMGSGTTGKVAHDYFQHYIGFDLNPKYVKMAERRIGAKNFMDLMGV